jgi:hypothetical protein
METQEESAADAIMSLLYFQPLGFLHAARQETQEAEDKAAKFIQNY